MSLTPPGPNLPGPDSPRSAADRETPLGRDGSGVLTLVTPVVSGQPPQLLKRFDVDGSDPNRRVRLAQRLWRLSRLSIPTLPGFSVAQARANGVPACWAAAPDGPVLGPEPRLNHDDATMVLLALVDTLVRAHQARVSGLRFQPEMLVWQRETATCRWLAPDFAATDRGPGAATWETRCQADLRALAQSVTGWLSLKPPPDAPLGQALAALETPGALGAAATMRAVLARFGHTASSAAVPAPAPLLGRAAELTELAEALQLAAADYRLVTTAYVGRDGAFEEELFDTLAAEWGSAGVVVLTGRCRGENAVGAALREIITQVLAVQDIPPAPALETLLNPEAAAPGPVPLLPPAAARSRIFRAVDEALRRCRGQGPLVIALNAYDSADELTTAWVSHLLAHDAGMPCLLVLVGSAPMGDPAVERVIHGTELSPEEAIALAEAYLSIPSAGSAIPSPATTPEAMRAFSTATSQSRPRIYRWAQRQLSGLGVHLPEGVRELLRAFATIGAGGDMATLFALMEMPAAAFFELFERALDGGWLLERGSRIEWVVPDDVAVIQADMKPGDALRWHRRLAALSMLPAAERVTHALVGGPEGLAISLALTGSHALLALGAPVTAEHLATRAVEAEAADEVGRVPLLLALAYMALERRPERQGAKPNGAAASAWLEQAAAEIERRGDTVHAFSLAWLKGLWLAEQGDEAAARVELVHGAKLANEAGDRARLLVAQAALVMATRRRSWSLVVPGAREEAMILATQALTARTSVTDALTRAVIEAEVRLILAQAAASVAGQALHAMVAFEEALHAAEVACHAPVAYQAANALARLLGEREQLGQAADLTQQARLWAVASGRPDWVAASDVSLALNLTLRGLFGPALAHLPAEATVQTVSGADSGAAAWARAVRAIAGLHLGNLHDALALLEEPLLPQSVLGGDPAHDLLVDAQIWLATFLGRFADARKLTEATLEAVGEAETPHRIFLRLVLAEVTWRLGDRQFAAGLYAALLNALGSERPAARARALIGQARVDWEAGTWAAAQARLTEAEDLAESAGFPLLLAEIACVRGDVWLAAGNTTLAQDAYHLALARADSMESPHHRAVALVGLAAAATVPAAAAGYRQQAAAQLAVFLDQLGDARRRDFLAWEERAQALTPTAPSRPRTLGVGVPAVEVLPVSDTIDDVLAMIAYGAPPDTLLSHLTEAFRRQAKVTRALLFLRDEAGAPRLCDRSLAPEAATMFSPDTPLPGVVETVLRSGETLFAPDIWADPRLREETGALDPGVKGLLCVPLIIGGAGSETRVLGCLYGDCQPPLDGLMADERKALERLARHVAVALHSHELETESQRKTERLALLSGLTRALAGTLDVDALLTLALRQALAVTHSEQGYIFFGDGLPCHASLDREGQPLADIQVSRSVIERVVRDRQPLTILDIGQDEEMQQKASLMLRNVRSVMCVPLLLDDHLLGLIYVSSSTANRTFGAHDLDVMGAIATQVALMLQNVQAYETIKDLNTGLEAKVKERTQALEVAIKELSDTQAQLLETERLATVGTLAAGVAHEINNPLGAVLTNAQLLKLDIEDPEQLDSLTLIEEGAKRCTEIVKALLKYSRPPESAYMNLDWRALVEDTLVMVLRQLADGINLESDLAACPPISGDPAELRQVLLQVLLNAADAILDRDDDQAGTIQARLRHEDVGLVLQVTDDGAGMPPDVLKRIFDPFFTTKAVGSGTGLGLPVCQRVIDKHGGKISATSEVGKGTTVTIVLPVATPTTR